MLKLDYRDIGWRRRLLTAILLLLSSSAVFADTITTKDGKSTEGKILFQNDSEYWISVDGEVEKINISDIEKINFDKESNHGES